MTRFTTSCALFALIFSCSNDPTVQPQNNQNNSTSDVGNDDSGATDLSTDLEVTLDVGSDVPIGDTLCEPQNGEAAICETGPRGPVGDLRVLFGMSIQEPARTDMNGDTIDESSIGDRWLNLPRDSFRFPAGTDSYLITDRTDPKMVYFFDTFLPKYPGVKNDQTWGPQVATADFENWLHDDVQRVTLGNEPPIHPEYFADGDAYVTWAKSVVDAYPALADQFWIQTGKPEFINLELVSPGGLVRHRDLLQTAGEAMRTGELPARIVTTHKVFDEFPDDRLQFYRDLLDDYREATTDDVKICFQELKLGRGENLSFNGILRVTEFLLVMSRLRHEQGDIVHGATYQQGFASGTNNLIGLDDPGTPEWTVTALTDIWELFGDTMIQGRYVETERDPALPATVQVELFELDGTFALLYSNAGDAEVRLADLPGTISNVGESLQFEETEFSGALPARSTGAVFFE